jgi:hypothetical protein
MNVNMVTCGGQATIPMVARSRVQPVEYGEIVATVSSRSAGPGTRKNIDEFTRTTAGAVEKVGGAKRGKAIIILNPAEPPLIMRDTVHCLTETNPTRRAITASIHAMIPRCRSTCPATAGQRPGVRRQPRLGLPRGRGPGRLPAQVRRQPRHHDRRRRAHRRDVRRGDPAGKLTLEPNPAVLKEPQGDEAPWNYAAKITLHDMTLRDGMHPKRHQMTLEQMKSHRARPGRGRRAADRGHARRRPGRQLGQLRLPGHTDEEYLSP